MLEALGESGIQTTTALPEGDLRDDDSWLAARLRQGDESAFEAVYRREERRVYAFALRLSQRPEEAADLTQEVFVKAWERRRKFESLAHFAHWLRRVVVNDWINGLRRQRPLSLGELEESDERGAASELVAPPTRESAAGVDLERALAELSPRLRAVFLLFDVHGHTHDEIAELMEMTPGASKVQLHRARARLREMLR